MTVPSSLPINIVGGVIFCFVFWKKLKEDYISNQIFSTALLIIIGISVSLLAVKNVSQFEFYWFWLVNIGFLSGLTLGILKYRLRFYETFEAAFASLLLWFLLFVLYEAVVQLNWLILGYGFFVMTVAVLYFFLNKHYKSFAWYKSGKVGFSGLSSAAVFFLIRGLIAIVFPNMLSFAGSIEPILSGVLSFILFLLTLNLSLKV